MKSYSGLMSVYFKENPKLFQNALESIITQTVPPNQFVLIIDGKLTDILESVIQDFKFLFEKKGITFQLVRNKKNLGLGLSLRKGVKFCSNNLIARFDSDDINDKHRMEKTLQFFYQDESIALVGTNIAEFETSPDLVTGYRIVPSTNYRIKKRIVKRNPFNHMTVTFKKDVVEKVGNYQNIPYFEDYYLWFSVVRSGYRVANINENLVYAHTNQDSLNRRSGFQYLKKEVAFQSLIFRNGFISLGRYLINISTRGIIRLIPKKVLKYVYKILRKGDSSY